MASFARALKHRNYRLFFGGQSISLIGTWLTRVATSWLVYRLSRSASVLGLVTFAGQLPTFIVAPFGGVLVDRWNKHRTLLVTQVLALVQSSILAALTITGRITVMHVLWLSVFQGLINAFDMPVRQSFLVEMIEDKADLPNAIALNSSMFNMARLVGPSIAGLLIAFAGEGGCFAVDAASYVPVIISVLLMRVAAKPEDARRGQVLQELREGFGYVSRSAAIRAVLGLMAWVSFVGMPYTVLLPMVVTERLGGGAGLLGWLMAATGLGALSAALYLAARKSVLGLGKLIWASTAVCGLGLMLFSVSRWLLPSLALMVVVGMGMMIQMAATNTILQTIVDEDKRGRVMSYYTMAFAGAVPFGSLLAGFLADRMGSSRTLLLGGLGCVLGAFLFRRSLPRIRAEIRPLYVRLGILPEAARGIQSASILMTPPED